MINTTLHIKIVDNIDDMDICYKLREKVFIEEQNVPRERERDEEDNLSVHFLIFDNNTSIGTARILPKNGDAVIGRLCILKEHRGKNAGMILMKEIIEYCKKQSFEKILLGSQEHAIGFYSKLGFEVCSGRYIDANIAHYKMHLIYKLR
ncbi:MAG: GNAT family N-acetyltransferase [bacterium]